MSKVEVTYFPGGGRRSEVTMEGEVPHGVTRHWHANGVLALEIPLSHGRICGQVSQWAEDGRLLGTFEMSDGNGYYFSWHSCGTLASCVCYVDGEFSGPQVSFYENGDFTGSTFWLHNRPVSKVCYERERMQEGLPSLEDVIAAANSKAASGPAR